MTLETIISDIGNKAVLFIQQFFPDIPAEAISMGGAALLGALAILCLIIALRMAFRSPSSRSKRVNVPRTLQREGTIVDIANSLQDDDVAVRCVITSVSSGKIQLEIIERLDVLRTKESKEIVCVFAPLQAEHGKINCFTAKLIESDKSGRKTDRIILAAPSGYQLIPRRKHPRKRVADQQFIRVKLWIADPKTSDIAFEDAAPHIGVNSFSPEGPDQTNNAVVNISNGGLGLSIINQVIPETCAVGAQITLNLFMFNFREKSFKPYWYSAEIRSMEEGRPGYTRIGLQFNGEGNVSDKAGTINWTRF